MIMFIDTSGWLCLYHKDEPEHGEAIELYQNARVRLTTNYVLAEFVPLAQVRGFPRMQNPNLRGGFWIPQKSK